MNDAIIFFYINFPSFRQKNRELKGAVPKVMTATLNVVVSINSTTVMQTYWTAPL